MQRMLSCSQLARRANVPDTPGRRAGCVCPAPCERCQRSRQMIDRYKRTARTFAELELGPLSPLDFAPPELCPIPGIAAAPEALSTAGAPLDRAGSGKYDGGSADPSPTPQGGPRNTNGAVAKRLGNGLQNHHTWVRIPSAPPVILARRGRKYAVVFASVSESSRTIGREPRSRTETARA